MTERIRTALLGAAGRMGHILTEMLNASDTFELVARVDMRTDSLTPAIIGSLADAPDFDILIDFSLPQATQAALLAEALELLTERERKVILLYYYEELTLKEISGVLEVSESRVSQLHTRALQKMRTRMGKYLGILTEIK